MTNRLEFYAFHLMPYRFIPPGEEFESIWITLPNSHYDPRQGYKLYQEYFDQLAAAEKFGYDGILVNEHHQTAYAVQPAPNLWAAYLAAKTQHIKIGVVGNALPLHRNPVRVAEEIAMLDVLSGGRIISGHVRAMGAEYISAGVDPTTSKERFWEANDLIVKAWTSTEPFTWQGEHYDVEYVNMWPRPLQQPHPPIWLPGSTSPETIDEAARRRYPYMLTPTSNWLSKSAFDRYRFIAEEECGYTPDPRQMGRLVHTHVAETDEQAHREARAHIMWFFRNSLKIPGWMMMPPGYNTAASMQRTLEGKAKAGAKGFGELSYEDLVDGGYVIVGSPQTVIEKYEKMIEDYGIGMVMSAGGHLGSMPNWMVMKNMQIMAEEVFPHFRDPHGQPTWALQESIIPSTFSGHAAQIGKPALRARVRIDGNEYLDSETGYIPEVIEELESLRGQGMHMKDPSARP
jgi:alkanesulfonate monooxygenase SsuD/methylene tetrahydromethanopterin reductase-like flavin-dependent oxidoreductase (luciferase family)